MNVAAIITTTTTSTKQQNGLNGSADHVPLLNKNKLRNPSDLQIKLEKQLQKSRQVRAEIPTKKLYNDKDSTEQEKIPLVSEDNMSEDDYFHDVNLQNNDDEIVIFKQPIRGKTFSDYSSDCTDQLLRDGFRLDELSDDEDLDLIPPKPAGTSWCACQDYSCNIQ